MSRNVRILHLSDLHMRSIRGPQGERALREHSIRNRVITSTGPAGVRELLADGKPVDVIAFTGDLGDWGDPTDYPDAIKFLRELCELVELDPQRLFIVPGNHDIARQRHAAVWKALRDALPTASPRAVSEWMAGGVAPPGFDDTWRDAVLERERPFWDAITGTLLRADLAPWSSPHGRLGYRATFEPGPRGLVDLGRPTFPIHLIGLDSAWLAGDDHDPGALRLTDHQVELLATHDGASLPGLRIALMHHGFADLADGPAMRARLADRVDLVLHGHQHEATTRPWPTPSATCWSWPPAASMKATSRTATGTPSS
jgi:predicted MPP superfamily phosphohydrolase